MRRFALTYPLNDIGKQAKSVLWRLFFEKGRSEDVWGRLTIPSYWAGLFTEDARGRSEDG